MKVYVAMYECVSSSFGVYSLEADDCDYISDGDLLDHSSDHQAKCLGVYSDYNKANDVCKEYINWKKECIEAKYSSDEFDVTVEARERNSGYCCVMDDAEEAIGVYCAWVEEKILM